MLESRAFHDAKLDSIEINWQTRELCMLLSPVSQPPQALLFKNVRRLLLPHEDPWGPSVLVNAVREVDGGLEIEMQSGDTIEIKADSWSVNAVAQSAA